MAVRTSQTPTGSKSKSEFDQLLRQEISRSRGRGGETDTQGARDRVAKRLNAQEGRSRNSSAYKPGADKSPSKGKGQGTQGRLRRGAVRSSPSSSNGAGVPTPTPRPDTSNPWDDMNKFAPDGAAAPDSGSNPLWWMLPLLAASSRKGTDLMSKAPPEFIPPGGVPVRSVETTRPDISQITASGQEVPMALEGRADVPALAYHPQYALPAPQPDVLDQFMQEGDRFRNLTDAEIMDLQRRAAPLDTMESGMSGTIKPGRGDVNLPPIGSKSPGFFKPVIKYTLP